MQGSELKMWEGEWEFWGQQGLHVVSYNGSAAARNVIAEHELWLAPGCLDGRAPKRVTADMPHKVCPLDTACTLQCLIVVAEVCDSHDSTSAVKRPQMYCLAEPRFVL